jgi:hypothetical protein
MAGCSQAYSHRVLAGRIEAELVIESSHAIDIRFRYAQKLGNLLHGLPGEIAQLPLNLLQNRNKVCPSLAQFTRYLNTFRLYVSLFHENSIQRF